MVAAGMSNEVHVFPGVEVTTASGSDGAHLIIFGDQDKTEADFVEMLAGVCGFNADHPRFQPNGTPAAAPRTLPQILDDLPEDYLAIAPHAFNDNGIASQQTIEGDLRWKALHHTRLGAIDVGDASGLLDGNSFKAMFVRRELDHFPCLPNLAFVSTSDAYSVEDVGSHYAWIRMAAPALEAIRQAFLDHEARIICDWDPRFHGTAQTPNDIAHAWVQDLAIDGLSTAGEPLRVRFDPRLNVLIGGRGAGKSTVIAALRCLYGDMAGLPPQTRAEAQKLISDVFSGASVVGTHHLPHSGDEQVARWSVASGATTDRAGATNIATSFKVRVVNQKELFERAANNADDPHMTSRNLINLVDDALASGTRGPGSPSDFRAGLDELQTAWVAAARHHRAEFEAVAERGVVSARVEELRRQVAAFDDEANRARRERNDQRIAEARWLEGIDSETTSMIAELREDTERRLGPVELTPPGSPATADATAAELAASAAAIRAGLRNGLLERFASATEELEQWRDHQQSSSWRASVDAAIADTAAYTQELAELGLDPSAYERVRAQLLEQENLLEALNSRAAQLADLQSKVDSAWAAIEEALAGRREHRVGLLQSVEGRSQILRFSLHTAADETGWTQRVRELLNLRADGFLEEVPALARWLWTETDGADREERLALWREACVSGDFDGFATAARLRSTWATRLSNLDPLVRARLGAEIPEDTVSMRFLRQGGDAQREQDWQPLTAGSPGQRSAAMLSFVLHHGDEPLVLDQPEDDLDTEWITELVVRQLRTSRWSRQLIVVTHNANIPVNADAERTIVLENAGRGIGIRTSPPASIGGSPHEHCGPLEDAVVRADIQQIMEGGIDAFVRRERRYNNELNSYRAALQSAQAAAAPPVDSES
jgi:DNA repair ATPase RecN